MLTGTGLLLLFGYIGGKLVSSTKLPPLIGMLLVGMALGPYVLNWLDSDLLTVSQDIRTFALIVILLRAGLGIKKDQIKQVGTIALKTSSIPCILEGLTITALAVLSIIITAPLGAAAIYATAPKLLTKGKNKKIKIQKRFDKVF